MSRISKELISNTYQHLVSPRCRTWGMMISTCSASAAAADDEFVVKVTSKSFIKPSSQTPPKFRQFNLSILDQLIPSPVYSTFVIFYPKPTAPILHLLRDSLSKTLTHFYPLAGQLNPHHNNIPSTISCNDRGAEYLEAEANQDMLHFLSSSSSAPNIHLLGRLAPVQISSDMPLARAQITMFPCGGIALGISLNHIIADAHTFILFLNHWSSIARGDSISVSCDYNCIYANDMLASIFPANDAVVLKGKPLSWRKPSEKLAVVMQRFVFNPSEITELKSRVRSSEVPNPSRSVAIFGLIWKAAVEAHRKRTISTSSSALVIVDLRPRLKKPIPDYSVGNLIWGAVAHYHETGDDDELKQMACELKKSAEEVDSEFIESLKGEMGHRKISKLMEGRGDGEDYTFTSVVKMGINEVDFGWGKPIWVSLVGIPVTNCVCLMKATAAAAEADYDGGGNAVEAWVSLPEKEMAIFEQDPQLLQYAAVNPKVV